MGERRGTKALELWCRRMTEGYPGVRIENMTTSWRDGMAFCALVHRFRPDLIDFDKLNASDVFHNNELAFRVAEAQLGIPALLDATDMASYEVPDRLSILTYLSQYYQTFAAHQESASRLKRASITSVTDTVSPKNNSGGPPAKMQHVLKREPCHKCQLPVFLAERLVHGARLYHRTCMRCARCKSQLTPGNFYETEQDDEFCCETCPDEDHRDADVDTESRKSFSNKLALFQTKAVEESGKGLLAKSLSDEEKSKSLKRLTAMYSMQSEASVDYKSGAGMSTFMSAQLGQAQTNTNGDDHEIVESEDDDDDDDESDEEDEPPQLPVAKPPIATYKPSIATKPITIAISTATTTTTNVTPVTESKTLVQPAPTHTEKPTEPPVVGTAAPTEDLGLNIPDDAKETNLADSDTKDLSEASTVTRLIGVRDRLHMFETNSENKSDEPNSRTSCKKLFDDPVPDDPDIHDPVVPVAETIEIPDVIEPEENASSNKETLALEHFQELALRQAIEEINDKVHEHEEERKSQTPEPLPPQTPTPPPEPLPSRTPSPPPVVPTPRKRTPKLIANVVEPSQPTEKPEIKIRTTTDLAANEVQPKPVLEPKESYPIEYNPFDDNDDEAVDEPVVEHNAAKRHSLNPFDSSDDEVELDKVVEPKVTVHVVEPTTTVSHSLNPFGSESEDEDDPADSKRTPVPTPRKITPDLSSLHSTPEPTPRASRAVSMTPQNLNRTIGYLETPSPLNRSHNHFGSTTSLASTTSTLSAYTRRHKSRAPLPPPSASKLDVVTASTSNSPCPSNRSSPCTSNRNTPTLSRKKRIAPPPPSAAKPIAEIDEKAFDQSRLTTETTSSRPATPPPDYKETPAPNVVRKLIPIDVSLIEENESAEHLPSLPPAPTEVVYRRTIMPLDIAHSPAVISNDTHDRQWQKVKENKESLNKNRQSQGSMSPECGELNHPVLALPDKK